MNMKILSIILILGSSVGAFAAGSSGSRVNTWESEMDAGGSGNEYQPRYGGTVSYADSQRLPPPSPPTTTTTTQTDCSKDENKDKQECVDAKNKREMEAAANLRKSVAGKTPYVKCPTIVESYDKAPPEQKPKEKPKDYSQCKILMGMSQIQSGTDEIELGSVDGTWKSSVDYSFKCYKPVSYTVDYEACVKALDAYNVVVIADKALDLEQKVRTDLKNSELQNKTTKAQADGKLLEGVYDAGIESNKHQKGLQTEKMIAYSAAVAALAATYSGIPGEKLAKQRCSEGAGNAGEDAKLCNNLVQNENKRMLANQEVKTALIKAGMTFLAKGIAAGIAMKQYDTKAKQTEVAKKAIEDDTTDLMMERCVLNPTDPACAKDRNRTPTDTIAQGDFGFSGGESNSFNMAPDSTVAPEMGAETNLDGDNAPVAGVNTPFANDAKIAKGILDPAAGAQMQATGGAQGGGGGGGAGGGGGGGASLGSDLNGANKDGDKEAQVKTNKVAGAYSQGGGGGYKGVGKSSKDDANPFASLFDAKGSGGGVEEDRSIASGDIDGAASGLFQKISKRYGQVQADKRLEAKNLE